MTRSQTKQRKTSISANQLSQKSYPTGKARRDVSTGGSGSAKTTESMKKLAKEALDIGERLGIKVINNKENALKRITNSLKNNRP